VGVSVHHRDLIPAEDGLNRLGVNPLNGQKSCSSVAEIVEALYFTIG